MKMIVVVQNGKVINVGPWDYLIGEDGVVKNPLPDGANEGEFDVVITAEGRYVLSNAYQELRRAEYPSIGDQLGALFEAGVFPAEMADKIAAIKAKYPKV